MQPSPSAPTRRAAAKRDQRRARRGGRRDDVEGGAARLLGQVDELIAAAKAATRAQTRALTRLAGALGKDALATMTSWRPGTPPPPPAPPEDVARSASELGAFLVDLHVEEVRRATDAFVTFLVDLSRALADAEAARRERLARLRPALVALFGDELVDDAASFAPTARRVLELHTKRAHMSEGNLATAMALVGDEWQRDADAGDGKLVVTAGPWRVSVDVAHGTFRVRELQLGRSVGVDGAPLERDDDVTSPLAHFTRSHFRIG